jgi:hypothetical protein
MKITIIIFAGLISQVVAMLVEDDFVYCPLDSLNKPISFDRYCDEPIDNLIKLQHFHSNQQIKYYSVKPLELIKNQTIFECVVTEIVFTRIDNSSTHYFYKSREKYLKPNKEQCKMMFEYKSCTQPDYTEVKMTCTDENNCRTNSVAWEVFTNSISEFSWYFNKSDIFIERECQIITRTIAENELNFKNCNVDSTFCELGESVVIL